MSRIYEALKKAEELRSASEGTPVRPLWPGSFTDDNHRAESFPMPQFFNFRQSRPLTAIQHQ